jgi:hypothetical protein
VAVDLFGHIKVSGERTILKVEGVAQVGGQSLGLSGTISTTWDTSTPIWNLRSVKLTVKSPDDLTVGAGKARKIKLRASREDTQAGIYSCNDGILVLQLTAELRASFIPARTVFVDVPVSGSAPVGCVSGGVDLDFSGDFASLFGPPSDGCFGPM